MPSTNRSQIEDRWRCPRLAFWNYHADGHGWDSQPGFDLLFGTHIHNVVEAEFRPDQPTPPPLKQENLLGLGWEPATAQRILQFAGEVVGLTFKNSRAWRNIMDVAGAGTVQVEKEFTVPAASGFYQSRPDLLFCSPDGEHTIVNIKTTSFQRSDWGLQPAIIGEWWALHQLKYNLRGSWVFQVNKGRRMKPEFAPAYYSGPLFIAYQRKDELSPVYKPGWDRIWLWEKTTPEAWVQILETTKTLDNIYNVSGPHLPSEEQLGMWSEAVTTELAAPVSANPNDYPAHFGHACTWPTQCPAYNLCWGMARLDPESNGLIPRIPNHPEVTQ